MPTAEAMAKALELHQYDCDCRHPAVSYRADAPECDKANCRECLAAALDAFAEERVREVAGRVGERVAEEVAAIVQREKHAAVKALVEAAQAMARVEELPTDSFTAMQRARLATAIRPFLPTETEAGDGEE